MNRWENIADFLNAQPGAAATRTKEECIAKFQQPLVDPKDHAKKLVNATSTKPPPSPDQWTDAQQKQLEDALAKFPSSLDKNERWTSIAGAVDGKSKKECVERFKAIREASKK